MTPPWYRVTVASITESWSYDCTQGDEPDPDDVVQLADGLSYAWEWEGGLISGQLAPSTATVRLWCRTADDVPPMDVGDLFQVTVEIYDGHEADWVAIIDKVMRVSAVDVDLTPPDDGPVFGTDPAPYSALVTVDTVDLTADLRAMVIDNPLGIAAGTYGGLTYPYRSNARTTWRYRLAEVAALIARTVGAPTWWATTEDAPVPTFGGTPSSVPGSGMVTITPEIGGFGGKTAWQLLSELCNTWQPIPSGTSYNITHAIAPHYGASYPTDYAWVAGAAGGTVYNYEPAPTDPASTIRYMLVPASRRATTSQDWHGGVALDADWCRIPAKARRSREHIVNNVRLGGRALVTADDDPLLAYKWTDTAVEFSDATDVAGFGPSTRELPTQLILYRHPNPVPVAAYPAVDPCGNRYLSVTSARNAGYTYDTFVLQSSLVPNGPSDNALGVLGRLAPRWPGEAWGDGQLLRYVSITNLDPAIAFGALPPASIMPSLTPTLVAASVNTLGSEFTVNNAGNITALRFYKVATSSLTTRTLRLWTVGGTLLGTATTTETPGVAGWVQAPLTTPVPVAAGQTYVVGYEAPDGFGQIASDPTPASPVFTWVTARYTVGTVTTMPATTAGGLNWLADVVFESPGTVTGFLRAGVMSVADGDITWNLTLTPGDPT